MLIVCITSVRHVLTVNGYGGRQTKVNEKRQCFKEWETLVNSTIYFSLLSILIAYEKPHQGAHQQHFWIQKD